MPAKPQRVAGRARLTKPYQLFDISRGRPFAPDPNRKRPRKMRPGKTAQDRMPAAKRPRVRAAERRRDATRKP